ncbi:hypothetical protein BC826DRAFT_1107354 [Russula brevipes]|nr:hypothetical protein BC826DRAFT_1107354 [Russula brevipes]
MLRLVSFSVNSHWACSRILGITEPGSPVGGKKRPAVLHSRDTYTFRDYFAYAIYASLYIAGPSSP